MTQKIILLNTAQSPVTVSVAKDGTINTISQGPNTRRGQDGALPLCVDQALGDAAIEFDDLSALAVVTGPGSFTGLRMGMAYALGVQMTQNIPVLGFGCFEVLARQMSSSITAPTLLRFRLKHDQWACQVFDTPSSPHTKPQLLTSENITAMWGDKPILTLGDHDADVAHNPPHETVVARLDLSILAQLADAHLRTLSPEENQNARETLPKILYVRGADVTLKDKTGQAHHTTAVLDFDKLRQDGLDT